MYKTISVLAIISTLSSANAFSAELDKTPKGISGSDWSGIRAAHEDARHAAIAADGGFVARNPGQQWRTQFDGRGFINAPDTGGWSWGLELVGYGWDGAERLVSTPGCIDSNGRRVEYRWDENLTEWYVNDGRGLEHGFTVQKRQKVQTSRSQNSQLRIEMAVRGNLRARVSSNDRCVTFVNNSGAVVVNYGGLKVFDATGAERLAWFEPGSGHCSGTSAHRSILIVVDDTDAIFPLTIDPIAQQQAYVKASNTQTSDWFGYSVAVSGDTAVVGAPLEFSNATGVNGNQNNNTANFAGAAYVFVRSGSVWSQQAYLKASNTAEGDNFGRSVAVSDDTVVVGSHGEDSSATGVNGNQADNSTMNSGAAYVFVRVGTTWTQQAYLKASNPGALDSFGLSVAVSGDTVVVGAYEEDSNATGVDGNQADNSAADSGAAYVFVRNGTTWSQQAFLKASNSETGVGQVSGDRFGASVDVSGDTVVVGAWSEDSNATGVNGSQFNNNAIDSGAAYVFFRSGAVWSQQAFLKASNTGGGDFFGGSVAASGNTVVVGAAGEDSSARGVNTTGLNGSQDDNSAANSGAAYVFIRSGEVWSQQAYLKASNSETGIGQVTGDRFGWSVDLSGDTVVVGAYEEDSGATGVNGHQDDNSEWDSGAAYVYIRSGGAWSQQAYIKASNTEGVDEFGYSVAASGETVIVGALNEDGSATGVNGNQADNGAASSGAAYIIQGSDWDNDGVLNAVDVCATTSAGLPVDSSGRPLSDLNNDCNVNGLDVQTYVNDPSLRPIDDFVADLLL